MCDRWQACSECYAGPGGALLTQLLAGCLDKKETTGCQAESGSTLGVISLHMLRAGLEVL